MSKIKTKKKRKRGIDFYCDFTKKSLVMRLKYIKKNIPPNNASKERIYKYLKSLSQLPEKKPKIGKKCKNRIRKRQSEPEKPINITPPDSDDDVVKDIEEDDIGKETNGMKGIAGSGIRKGYETNVINVLI